MRVVLLGFTAFALASCSNVPHPPGEYWTTVTGKVLYYHDYATDAEGATIVLVHGGWVDGNVWKYNTAGLSDERRVIVIDLPGHGRSEIPAKYTMNVFANAIKAALDDAGVQRAVLVGQSNGVPTIRHFYRRYPERTLGLVLVDGPLRESLDKADLEAFLAELASPRFREVVLARVAQVTTSSTLLTEGQVALIEKLVRAAPQETVLGDIARAAERGALGRRSD